MTYEEKLAFLKEHVQMPGTQIEGEHLMRVLSLISNLTMKSRAKEKTKAKTEGRLPKHILPKHIIIHAAGKPEGPYPEEIYEKLSLHCDLLISHDAKFDDYGAPDAKTMLAEIKRTIDTWLPF